MLYKVVKKLFAAIMILFFMSLTPTLCQTNQLKEDSSKEQWWENLPASPLKISLSPNGRFLTVTNYTLGHIVGYRLGCIDKQQAKIVIASKMPPQKTDLNPSDFAKDRLSFATLRVSEITNANCDSKKTKLTVIEVKFADGSIWKIK